MEEESASQVEIDTGDEEKDETNGQKRLDSSEGSDDSAIDTQEVDASKDGVYGARSAEELDNVAEKLQQEQPEIVEEAAGSTTEDDKEVETSISPIMEAKEEREGMRVEKAQATAKVGFAARLFGSKSAEELEVNDQEEDAKEEGPPDVPVDEAALSKESARANNTLEIMQELGMRRRLMMQARRDVLKGLREKTSSGLTKDDLIINRRGAVVSKKLHERGKLVYAKTLKGWTEACVAARAALDITGFVAVGGSSERGQQLYKKAKEFYERSKRS